MGSVLTSTANVALFVLGCFLAADTANEVIAALLLAPSQEISAPTGTAPPARSRGWSERQIILSRNLFNASTLAPAPLEGAAEEEDIEKSRLPVQLLGTFAATDPDISRATLLDKEKNETLVVGVGDQIKEKALVTRIERRRVVLTENGAPRELTLDDEHANARSPITRRERNPRQRPVRNPRGLRRNDRAVDVSRDEIEQTLRNPTELLSQARILPKFEDGEMIGLQVNAIKSGSLFEEVGLEDGDVILELNGIAIDSPEQSTRILQEFAQAEDFVARIQHSDGSVSERRFQANED